ncbi:MAG: hypothetical protein ACIAXF_08465 [Phycisphaerales bacterium JB063]
MKTPGLLALLLTFSLLTGCGSDAPDAADLPEGAAPVDESQVEAQPEVESPDDAGASDAEGVMDDPGSATDDADTRTVEGLIYTVPEGWTVGGPKPMRTLTLLTDDGLEIAVGFWPNGVGGLEANLTRWLGQAGYNPGDAAAIQALRDGFSAVTLGDADATWMPLLDGGGLAMIGVWAPRGENPTPQAETWTLKITGDADTLRAQQDTLRAWTESLRFE